SNKEEAILDAAVKALKVMMTPLEFYHVDYMSSEAFTKGIKPKTLEEALKEISPKEPLLNMKNQSYDPAIFQWTTTKYNLLSQEEKETVLVNFWTNFFSPEKINAFPRLSKMMGIHQTEAMDSFRNLFDTKDDAEGTYFEEIIFDTYKCIATLKWAIQGRVFQESASGANREIAERQVACMALQITLGSQLYNSVLFLNQKFIWKNISRESIKDLIENPLEGAFELLEQLLKSRNLPAPVFEFGDAFHVKCTTRGKVFDALYATEEDAKNMAAFQALEYLFGSKLETNRV
ncbi:unnamed protein product, partial [Allacma fusca]